MNSTLTKRFIATVALAGAALGTTSIAQARSDVTWSIGISSPGVYVQPAPVYLPQPIYVQPRPYYAQPAPIYYAPPVVYSQPPAYGYYHHGPAWRRAEWERRHHHRYQNHHGRDRDHDRDGR